MSDRDESMLHMIKSKGRRATYSFSTPASFVMAKVKKDGTYEFRFACMKVIKRSACRHVRSAARMATCSVLVLQMYKDWSGDHQVCCTAAVLLL